VVRRLAADLAGLQEIFSFAPDAITFTTTASGVEKTVQYRLSDTELARRESAESWHVLAEDVYYFRLEPDIFLDEQGDVRLRGVTVTIQFGPETSDRLVRYVDVLNQPTWS